MVNRRLLRQGPPGQVQIDLERGQGLAQLEQLLEVGMLVGGDVVGLAARSRAAASRAASRRFWRWRQASYPAAAAPRGVKG